MILLVLGMFLRLSLERDIVESLAWYQDRLTDKYFRDAFAGGFVAGIVEGKTLEESIDMGQWLASLSIRELGPSYVPPIPDPDVFLPTPKITTHPEKSLPFLSSHSQLSF